MSYANRPRWNFAVALFALMLLLLPVPVPVHGSAVQIPCVSSDLRCIERALVEAHVPIRALDHDTAARRLAVQALNTTQRFWVTFGAGQNQRWVQVDSTLKRESTHALIYVDNSYNAADSDLQQLQTTFDNTVYPKITTVFGDEWKDNPSGGIDGDLRITILLTRLDSGVGGYFYGVDEMRQSDLPPQPELHSNEREMFYLNTDFLRSNFRFLAGTLAHEFQHMIEWNQKSRLHDVSNSTWLNEGLSEYATTAAGLNTPYADSTIQERIDEFRSTSYNSLLRWNENPADGAEDYSPAALFAHYLVEHYGGESILKDLVADTAIDEQSINNMLARQGRSDRFEQVFENWTIANLIHDTSVGEGAYGYTDVDIQSHVGVKEDSYNYWLSAISIGDGTQPAPVNDWSADYIRVGFPNPLLSGRTYRLDWEGDSASAWSVYEVEGKRVTKLALSLLDGKYRTESSVKPGSAIYYVIIRHDANGTGDYKLRIETLRNVAFTIDDTGSMSEEIDAVKRTVSRKVDEFVNKGIHPNYHLVTFKDEVNYRGQTSDAAEIKSWVNDLYSSGGGDCPEDMLGALNRVAQEAPHGEAWVMTDAPFHGGPGDVTTTIYNLVKAHVKVHPIIYQLCVNKLSRHGAEPGPQSYTTDSSLDPFAQIANETGGHYFRITSDETEAATSILLNEMATPADLTTQTDSVSAGTPRTYNVPIDSTDGDANVLLNALSGDVNLSLFDPSGAPVQPSDTGVIYTGLGNVKYYQIISPRVGIWQAQVSGEGSFALSASSDSQIHFEYLADTTWVKDQPITLRASLIGAVSSQVFQLAHPNGSILEAVSLYDDGLHDDGSAGDGIFAGGYTPKSVDNFYLRVQGTTVDGAAFERIATEMIRVQTVSVTPPADQDVPVGTTQVYEFAVTNAGATEDTFALTVSSSQGWAAHAAVPGTVTIGARTTAYIAVPVSVPADAVPGAVDETALAAISQSNPLAHAVASVATVATTALSIPSLETLLIRNESWQDQRTFVPGATIRLGMNGNVDGPNGVPVSLWWIVTDSARNHIADLSYDDFQVTLDPGFWGYDLSRTIPTNLGPGRYIFRAELRYGNQVLSGELPFNITPSPVAYYPFDGDLSDTSGHDHPGVMHGSIPFVPGVVGQAAVFDGTDWMFADNPLLPLGSTPRSLCLWAQSNDGLRHGNSDHMANWGTQIVAGAFGLKIYKGNTWWGYGHDPAYDTDSHVLAGTDWHFLCLTYDQSIMRIYVDGDLRGERVMALNTQGARLFVGVRADQTIRNTFHGRIDEVKIYNTALDAQDIATLYTSYAPVAGGQLTLDITAPPQLSVVNGQYTPNPFEVVATVSNSGAMPASNVELVLNLPDDLNVISTSTQFIGELASGEERQVVWSVMADPLNPALATVLDYGVTARGANVTSVTANLQLTLPAIDSNDCMTGSRTWQNDSLPVQTEAFTISFDATPQMSNMDGVTGLSSGSASAYTSLAAIVRFNPQGFIDARNGASYQADRLISYTPGNTYRFRLVMRIPSHTYDIFVTAAGRSEQVVGMDFRFRTEQDSVTSLDNLGLYAKSGTHRVCNVMVRPAGV